MLSPQVRVMMFFCRPAVAKNKHVDRYGGGISTTQIQSLSRHETDGWVLVASMNEVALIDSRLGLCLAFKSHGITSNEFSTASDLVAPQISEKISKKQACERGHRSHLYKMTRVATILVWILLLPSPLRPPPLRRRHP